jgi:hypothetical protein
VLVQQMSAQFKTVLAYGEMVNVLCEKGNAAGAIELEKLWNNLLREHSFALMCGYSMNNFSSHADNAVFREVCHLHTDAHPTKLFAEDFTLKAQAERLLQLQHARAQATELELKSALHRQMELVEQIQKELVEQ